MPGFFDDCTVTAFARGDRYVGKYTGEDLDLDQGCKRSQSIDNHEIQSPENPLKKEIKMIRCVVGRAFVALALSVGVARAETATIATLGEGYPIYYLAVAIAKAADTVTSLDVRPKSYRSVEQGAVFVDKGEVDFGLMNAITLPEAYRGVEFFKDRPLQDLRAVARLVPLQVTLCVPGNSDIQTIEDMRGKRFPAGFDATKFGERLYETMLGTGGLTYDDVQKVQISDWGALVKGFRRGEFDVGGAVVGSATSIRDAQLIEGFRCIPLSTGPGVEERVKATFPAARMVVVEPAEGLAGIVKPTVLLEFDYWLYAHKDASESKVTAVLQSLFDGKDALISVSKDFRNFDPALMNTDIGVPLHPAAEAFYAAHNDSMK
jgi:TRAP transporter TAXI family solute receptor